MAEDQSNSVLAIFLLSPTVNLEFKSFWFSLMFLLHLVPFLGVLTIPGFSLDGNVLLYVPLTFSGWICFK